MTVQIAVRLGDDELARLDAAIARGAFPSRAAAVRAGLDALLREEREAQIVDAYRRAYATAADAPAIGEAGLQLGALLLEAEDATATDPNS